MKKILSLGVLAMLIASSFVGCKKGENDPALSLLSRKARLTGVWDLTNADYETTDTYDGGSDITSYSYDGTSMTETTDGTGETYDYSEKMTIDKDGTFTSVTTKEKQYYDYGSGSFKTGTQTETYTGVWYFLDKNKDLDVKNKERVEFLVESYKQVKANGDTYEYEIEGKSNAFVMIILLDRLSNKEIVTLFDYIESQGADTYERSGTMTYTKE